ADAEHAGRGQEGRGSGHRGDDDQSQHRRRLQGRRQDRRSPPGPGRLRHSGRGHDSGRHRRAGHRSCGRDVEMRTAALTEAQAEVDAGFSRFGLIRGLQRQVQAGGVTVVMAVLFLVTGLYRPYFWEPNNLRVLAMNMSFIAIASVGTAILIISGNIDLSIGSILGLTAVLAGMFAKAIPPAPAFICAILVGGLVGLMNGVLVWNVSASPIIITLGVMTLLRGVVYVITGGEAIFGLPSGFTNFANQRPAGIPMPLWLAAGSLLVPFPFISL